MLVRPPDAVRFAYGAASFNAHRAQAAGRGLRTYIYRSPTSGLDLDVPDDLALYQPVRPCLTGAYFQNKIANNVKHRAFSI